MNDTMHAAAIDETGPPEVLRVREVPMPVLAPDGVMVRVVNAGVQPADAAIRSGWTPPGATLTLPQVLGNEFSGVVVDTGSQVDDLETGQAVLGFNVMGCQAQYVAVPRSQIARAPDGIAWEQAGALSASGQTALTAFEELGVAAGEVILVHGAAGGVGTMFTQLAVRAGATVVGTASAANQEHLRTLGATAVTYGPGQADRIRKVAPRIDAALDAAGHQNLRTAVELVADRSRVVTIVDMQLANELGCRIVRSRRTADRLEALARRVAAGELMVHIRATYPLAEVARAHRDVETGHGRGKVVLAIGDAQ